MAASAVRDRLLTALDHILYAHRSALVRDALRATDPDAFRDPVRDAMRAGDSDRLVGLAGQPEAAAQPPGFVAVLGTAAEVPVPVRRKLLIAAADARPGDLTLLMALGGTFPLNQRVGADDRARWYQAAVAVAPGSAAAHVNLGRALRGLGDPDGSIVHHGIAVRLAPGYAAGYMGLGNAHKDKEQWGLAAAAFGEWVKLQPENPSAHANMGVMLWLNREYDRAAACYEIAVRLAPANARLRYEFGRILSDMGNLVGAVEQFREASRLEPAKESYRRALDLAAERDRSIAPAPREMKQADRKQ